MKNWVCATHGREDLRRLVTTTIFGIALIAGAGVLARNPGAQAPTVESTAASAPLTGLKLMAEGKSAEALPLLEQECADAPGDAMLATARAQCLLNLARWKDALSAGRGLLKAFPGNPDARVVSGDIFFVTFHTADAVKAWWPLMKEHAQAARVLPRLLAALLANRRFDEAAKLAARARAARIPFTDGALRQAARASRCPARLDFLEELVKRHPDSPAIREKLKIERGVCEMGGTSTAEEGELPDEVRTRLNSPTYKVLLNGRKAVALSFDSGSQAVRLWGWKLEKKLGLTVLGRTITSSIGTDPNVSRQVLLEHFKLGGIEIANLPAAYRNSPYGWSRIRMGLGPFLDYVVEWDRRKGRFAVWPAGTSAETLFGGKPDVVLPVRWYDGVPLVPVSINGRGPFPFLFDTGAATTLLTAKFCPLLGLNPASSGITAARGRSASGWFRLRYLTGATLSIGGVKKTPPWIQATDVPQKFPGPVYGILGMDFIYDYDVVFDGPGCRILLKRYKGGGYRNPKDNNPEGRAPPVVSQPPSYRGAQTPVPTRKGKKGKKGKK